MLRAPAIAISVTLLLAGCSGLPELPELPGDKPGTKPVHVLERTDRCGTPAREAALHYFRDGDGYRAWLTERGGDGLSPELSSADGLLVLEMGQRPTAGYDLVPVTGASRVIDGTLRLRIDWAAPGEDAMVAQVLTSVCLVIGPPAGDYDRVKVVDQDGTVRARAVID